MEAEVGVVAVDVVGFATVLAAAVVAAAVLLAPAGQGVQATVLAAGLGVQVLSASQSAAPEVQRQERFLALITEEQELPFLTTTYSQRTIALHGDGAAMAVDSIESTYVAIPVGAALPVERPKEMGFPISAFSAQYFKHTTVI